MKVARTVLSGGKDGDNFKVLPIATNKFGKIPIKSTRIKSIIPIIKNKHLRILSVNCISLLLVFVYFR
ncbi:hypothetical protein C6359_30070 [Bacillus wiedmannii]|nr:hypothetical protein C6358_29955 [Bacillus wiedmannii]PRT37901.1 hypothetical protein C6359_30070 [Bacillus wiedmannii]